MKNDWNQDDGQALIRIVVDTNLWISFLIGKKLDCLLDLLENPWFEIVSTSMLNEEIVRVAQRPKFRKYFPEDAVERLKAWMDTHFSMFEIDGITPRCRDPKDDYLLELAVKSHAIYLVSGDEDLLELEHIEDCKIVTVAQFEAELGV